MSRHKEMSEKARTLMEKFRTENGKSLDNEDVSFEKIHNNLLHVYIFLFLLSYLISWSDSNVYVNMLGN